MSTLISSKYAGKCRTCRRSHDVGEMVYWTRGVKGVECRSCHAAGGNTPNPSPSARETTRPAPEAYRTPTAPLKLPAQSGTEGLHSVRIWESFAEYVASAKTTRKVQGERCWDDGNEKFRGTYSWGEAMNLADRGWDAVRPDVDALVEKIDALVAPKLSLAFESYFDVSGGTVDVGRFLDGEPECMVETRLAEIAKPGRVVTILINGSVMAAANTKDIIERGVAIVALVDSLEKMQHGTEIWLEMSCGKEFGGTPDKMPILTHLVKLKSAEDQMDIDMLMFAIAHPSRHRRLTFALRRKEPNMEKYGVPHESTCPVTQVENVGAALVLESLSYAGKTVNAEEWIVNTLSEFGLLREEG